ncbi:phosphatase PAP2 family protein [Micromonospora sp. NPDC004704]
MERKQPPGSPAGSAPERTAAELRLRRAGAMAVWIVAFVAGWLLIGLPTDPLYAFFWLWAATVAWRIHLPWRQHLVFARDWLPVVILLAIYNVSRGFADDYFDPHVTELIHADEWMFGWATGGVVPTIWLQEHLFHPDVRWYDVLASFVYFSHFVAALAAAVVLWLKSRPRWAAFMRRWFALSLAGLITYFVYPAAPPWWASVEGFLPVDVARISNRGWQEFGLHGAGNTLNVLQLASNPVAAMPSLHTAFALFVVLFFLPSVKRRWWPLLLAYPLAMTFTLVYTGEHYVIDVLVGWAYVVGVFLLVGAGERWWAARRARLAGPGPDPGGPHPPIGPSTGPAGPSGPPTAPGGPDEPPAGPVDPTGPDRSAGATDTGATDPAGTPRPRQAPEQGGARVGTGNRTTEAGQRSR